MDQTEEDSEEKEDLHVSRFPAAFPALLCRNTKPTKQWSGVERTQKWDIYRFLGTLIRNEHIYLVY